MKANADQAAPSTPNAARRLRVLIADDYDHAAELLATLVDFEDGLHGIAVNDGSEALVSALSHRPDVAVLDVDMPHVDGLAAARALREHFGTAAPLLIALTGRGDLDSIDKAQVFDQVLTKPVDLPLLIALLEAVRGEVQKTQ